MQTTTEIRLAGNMLTAVIEALVESWRAAAIEERAEATECAADLEKKDDNRTPRGRETIETKIERKLDLALRLESRAAILETTSHAAGVLTLSRKL